MRAGFEWAEDGAGLDAGGQDHLPLGVGLDASNDQGEAVGPPHAKRPKARVGGPNRGDDNPTAENEVELDALTGGAWDRSCDASVGKVGTDAGAGVGLEVRQ